MIYIKINSIMDSGIIIYEIELNGCLNGVYTNEYCDGVIYNEVARKEEQDGEITGRYACFYFDKNNKRENGTLTIGYWRNKKQTYDFSWEVNGKIIFKGKGYQMNQRQIAAHYWEP